MSLTPKSLTGPRILALDPAAKTGYAHSNGQHGVWLLTGRPGEHEGARLKRLEEFIFDSAKAWGCEAIAYEDAGFGSQNPNVQAMHNELRGVIQLAAAKLGVPTKGFKPKSIKLFATGHGKATKNDMIRACHRLLNIVPIGEDDADAIWILEFYKRPDCWPVPAKVQKRRDKAMKSKAARLF